jgi:hypothetical protein
LTLLARLGLDEAICEAISMLWKSQMQSVASSCLTFKVLLKSALNECEANRGKGRFPYGKFELEAIQNRVEMAQI